MAHHQLVILLKKQVQGVQVEAWRSHASGLLEADLIPGQILGLGRGAEASVTHSLCSLCPEECQSQWGRTGHGYLLLSHFTVPGWPSRALIPESSRGLMSVPQDLYFSASPPLFQALPRVTWALFSPPPYTASFQVSQREVNRQAGLFFVFEGAAVALSNDLRPGGKGTMPHGTAELTTLPVIFLVAFPLAEEKAGPAQKG